MVAAYTAGSVPQYRNILTDDERLAFIREKLFEGLQDDLVLWVARRIVAECPSRDEDCEINAIYNAVKSGPIPIPSDTGVSFLPALRFVTKNAGKSGLRFVEDMRDIDNYPTAGRILRWIAEGANGEDCDGHAILVCTLLHAIGFQTGAIIASMDGKDFTHIFPVVGVPRRALKNWIAVDTTVTEARPGWMPGASYGVKKMRVYAFVVDAPLIGRDL